MTYNKTTTTTQIHANICKAESRWNVQSSLLFTISMRLQRTPDSRLSSWFKAFHMMFGTLIRRYSNNTRLPRPRPPKAVRKMDQTCVLLTGLRGILNIFNEKKSLIFSMGRNPQYFQWEDIFNIFNGEEILNIFNRKKFLIFSMGRNP